MRRATVVGLAVGWGLLGAPAPSARADLIAWSYNTFVFPTAVQPDAGGVGVGILPFPGPSFPSSQVFFNPVSATVSGPSRVLLANLSTASTASAETPDTFKKHPFSVTVGILDQASNRAGLVTFQGVLDGTLSAQSSNLTVDFPVKTRALRLGEHLYEVQIDQIVAPGVPGSYTFAGGSGAIGARVTVRDNPEPGSLLLLGLGVPALGAVWWRRRKVEAARD